MSQYWKGKRTLVTGGAGFVGSNLVRALVDADAQVTVLDNLSSGKRENLTRCERRIHFIAGDVCHPATVERVVRGQDVVFHLAGNADVPRSVREPNLDFQSNVAGSFNVLRACVEAKTRVVASSSAAVYGVPQYVPTDEAHLLKPISPYGASKASMEHLGFAYAAVFGLKFTAVRIFNTYGEHQNRYVMVDLLRKLSGSPLELEVLGTGRETRTYCHISDACRLLMLAAQSELALGRAVNLVGEDRLTISELASLLIEMLGRKGKVQIRFTGESWPGDVECFNGDGTWAKTHLGFECRVRIREGLSRLIDWLQRENGWKLRQ